MLNILSLTTFICFSLLSSRVFASTASQLISSIHSRDINSVIEYIQTECGTNLCSLESVVYQLQSNVSNSTKELNALIEASGIDISNHTSVEIANSDAVFKYLLGSGFISWINLPNQTFGKIQISYAHWEIEETLIYAAMNGHLGYVQNLNQVGINPSSFDNSALFFSLLFGYKSISTFLLNNMNVTASFNTSSTFYLNKSVSEINEWIESAPLSANFIKGTQLTELLLNSSSYYGSFEQTIPHNITNTTVVSFELEAGLNGSWFSFDKSGFYLNASMIRQ